MNLIYVLLLMVLFVCCKFSLSMTLHVNTSTGRDVHLVLFAGWSTAFCFRSLPFVKHDVNLTLSVDWSTNLCLGPVGLTSRPIVSDWWSLGLTPSDPGRCSVSHSRFCFPSFSTGSLAQHATGHSCHSVYCLLLACSSPLALYCELSKNTHSIFFELTWLSYVFFLNSRALLTGP